ncbi:hypothetical protein BHM03_00021064 [Ensete ventricosum]|nr:hypothetical protein BHM03_00021064 [Ensete ventricosum]
MKLSISYLSHLLLALADFPLSRPDLKPGDSLYLAMVARAFSGAALSSMARSFSTFSRVARSTKRNFSISQVLAWAASRSPFKPWSSFSKAFTFSRASASPCWASSSFMVALLARASTTAIATCLVSSFNFRTSAQSSSLSWERLSMTPEITHLINKTHGIVVVLQGQFVSRQLEKISGKRRNKTRQQGNYFTMTGFLAASFTSTSEGVVYISLVSGRLRMPRQNTWASAPFARTLCQGINEAHRTFSWLSPTDSSRRSAIS